MAIRIGMKLELIEDLDCGIKVINKGEVFTVDKIDGENKVILLNKEIGVGVFNRDEVNLYFVEYKEPEMELYDVKRVIYNDNVTVVFLNSGVKGISKCMEEDTYNKEVGFRVAYLKAKIKELNKELKKF